MSPSEVEVQDHSSAYYEVRYSGYGRRYHQDLITHLMAEAENKTLDAGCGTGFVSALYPSLDITGIDISEGMLAKHQGHWLKMDAMEMSFADQSFDFILCRSLLHHLPDHRKGLGEMRRVLKPGGKITFLETNKSVLATLIRKLTQHGDRFSEYHHSFQDTELIQDIGSYFMIDAIHYVGFLAYPLFGFPDIINFQPLIPFKSITYPLCMKLDTLLGDTPWLKRLSWALCLHAHKA